MPSLRHTLPILACMLALGSASIAQAKPPEAKGEAVGVTAGGPPSETVSLEATLSPGKTPSDDMLLRVKVKAPKTQRVCIAYSGFEVVGIKRDARRYGGQEKFEHRCLDAPHTGVVSNTVTLQRRDIKSSLMGPQDYDIDAIQNKMKGEPANFRDGYVTVLVTLDGAPYVFKLTSPHFDLAATPNSKAD